MQVAFRILNKGHRPTIAFFAPNHNALYFYSDDNPLMPGFSPHRPGFVKLPLNNEAQFDYIEVQRLTPKLHRPARNGHRRLWKGDTRIPICRFVAQLGLEKLTPFQLELFYSYALQHPALQLDIFRQLQTLDRTVEKDAIIPQELCGNNIMPCYPCSDMMLYKAYQQGIPQLTHMPV